MPSAVTICVPTPVNTGALVSLPALTPQMLAAGSLPSAPKVSLLTTLPLSGLPESIVPLSAVAWGTSSLTLTVMVAVRVLPWASVTVTVKLSAPLMVLAPSLADGVVLSGLVRV